MIVSCSFSLEAATGRASRSSIDSNLQSKTVIGTQPTASERSAKESSAALHQRRRGAQRYAYADDSDTTSGEHLRTD